MSKRKRNIIWVVALSVICGLIIWHTVYWHSTGMHLEMFQWLEADRGHITVLYNLGLMLGLGIVLGSLMVKITDLIGDRNGETKNFDGEKDR